jgi:hypothetical protein
MRRAAVHGLCSIAAADDANIHWTCERQTQSVPSPPIWAMSIRSVSCGAPNTQRFRFCGREILSPRRATQPGSNGTVGGEGV